MSTRGEAFALGNAAAGETKNTGFIHGTEGLIRRHFGQGTTKSVTCAPDLSRLGSAIRLKQPGRGAEATARRAMSFLESHGIDGV